MTFPWVPISQPFEKAGDRYDVVVVGSGYGGGVAASRLARTGKKVAVLERGREIAPGDYPRDMAGATDEFQLTLSRTGEKLGSKRDGLYDLRINDDVNVLVGCGLGGTSLINANVALEPDPRVFDTWPEQYRNDRKFLAKYYDRARRMLGSKPYPAGKTPPKLKALEKVAEGMNAPFTRPDINVTFTDSHNAAGIWQAACTDCGDCVSGCNYGAKNTVLMNYLPDAERHGASLFTGAEVVSLAKVGNNWVLHVRDGAAETQSALRLVQADVVVLAAGTLGTNEILLRSRDKIALSDRLGEHFSGNGDIWAFGYNANIPDGDDRAWIYGIGAGTHDVAHGPTPPGEEPYKPGPCITGMVDLRDPARPLSDGVIIEEGVMPGALGAAFAIGFPALDALLGDPFRFGDAQLRLKDAADMGEKIEGNPLDLLSTVYEGPMARTMPFLVMSHDDSGGRLELLNDRVTVVWGGAGGDRAILRDEEIIRRACDAIQAEYLPNPVWQDALGNRLVTVHPLGGCSMADDVSKGVVNFKCQVFDATGDRVHDGLYVCDGAAMPRGLGVNPHLTIAAVAEYAVEQLALDREWRIDVSDGAPIQPPDTIDRAPLDAEAVLRAAIEGLRSVKTAIDNRMFELARMILKGFWRQLGELYDKHMPAWLKNAYPLPDVETFIRHMGDDETLIAVVSRICGSVLDILEALERPLSAGDYAEVLETAERMLGDFSPGVTFPETMTGHLGTMGLDDPTPAFDPYEIAGSGSENCTLTATIRADRLRTAIRPPDGTAEIVNGHLRCVELGEFTFKGKFRFLMPNEDKIDAWEMIYEGDLTGVKDGRALRFRGFKTLQYRKNAHWWRDLTDLRVEISDDAGPVARGMLRVTFEEAIRQANAIEIGYGVLLNRVADVYKRIADVVPEENGKLPEVFSDRGFLADCVKGIAYIADKTGTNANAEEKLVQLYRAKLFGRMGALVLRTYGGVYSYLMNFPAREAGSELPPAKGLEDFEVFHPEVEPGVYLKLTRYRKDDASLGPVILANGFGTKASSFATSTVNRNVVQVLKEKGFDVWLFDYRGSGDIEASLGSFTLDDVALKDWPAAIDLVTDRTGAPNVQVLVHCVGSMTLFMAVMAGESRVRSIVSSQLGPHAITNWFKFAQADSRTAELLAHGASEKMVGVLKLMGFDEKMLEMARKGVDVVDPRSHTGLGEPQETEIDPVIDALLWDVPSFAPVSCKNPTCHRINFIFGPSYRHENLNQATHNAITHMFGPVSTRPFQHIAKIFTEGRVVSDDGALDYFAHPERLAMPVHFIAGGRNQEMLPEATLRTLDWLRRANPEWAEFYTRKVYPEYGHMDCFIGKSADSIFHDLAEVLKEMGAMPEDGSVDDSA